MRKKLVVLTLLCSLISSVTFVTAPRVFAADSNSGDIVVQTIPGPSVADKLSSRAKTSWSWYITRASGLVAAVSLIILMLSGIGQITGYTYSFLEPITAWATHRALGITFAIAVLVHAVTLLFDHFVPFSILQLLVPWLSTYKPVTISGIHFGSLWVALGVLAFYAIAIISLSTYLWIDKKPYTWKFLHLLAYIVMLFVFVHALYLGTDLAHGLLRFVWIIAGFSILLLSIFRLIRAKTV